MTAAERAWTVAQLSDLHIVEEGELCVGVIDTAAFLRRAVAALHRLRPRPDVVLITGDLVNDGRPAQYARLRRLLEPLELPLVVIPGNHDARRPLRDALGLPAGRPVGGGAAEDAPCDLARRVGPLHLVGLDSVVPGAPGGALLPEQLDWLEETLAAEPGTPTIVAVHHPPFATGIGHMDAMALDGRSAAGLEAVIARHPQVERLVCGHVHRSVQRRWGGTVAMIVPGAAHAVVADLEPGGPPAWDYEPPGITLHHWSAVTGLVSHLVPIEPYPVHRY
jgi:3',5'-cyclic AMP phosphodiesterase CpdA